MAEETSRAWKDQYMLRLPDGMRDRIKRAAEANQRSMNQEIVATLEAAYPEKFETPDAVFSTMENIFSALTDAPYIDWRECIAHFANQQHLPPSSFGAFRSSDWATLTYRFASGRETTLATEMPLEDTIAEWFAQIEQAATNDEFSSRLDELNRFLAADPHNPQWEAVTDPRGTSPRLSGKAVVLRLKR